MMTTYYHGTNGELDLHSGLCLTPSAESAAHYGDTVYAIEIDTDSLRVDRLYFTDEEMRTMLDDQEFPADDDSEREQMIADGIDCIIYADSDPHGHDHDTLRVLSPAAIAACRVVEIA